MVWNELRKRKNFHSYMLFCYSSNILHDDFYMYLAKDILEFLQIRDVILVGGLMLGHDVCNNNKNAYRG